MSRRINQPHEVRRADGGKINWKDAPHPTKMCTWTKQSIYGHHIRGSFRTLCHMNRLNNLSREVFGTQMSVIQPDWNTTVEASAGTHDFDSVWDLWIPGVNGWRQQRFYRGNGAGGWYRHLPMFSNHCHVFSIPTQSGRVRADDFGDRGFKVGIYVPGQLADYYNHAYGLSGMHTPGSDHSWFPKSIKSTIFDLHKYIERRR